MDRVDQLEISFVLRDQRIQLEKSQDVEVILPQGKFYVMEEKRPKEKVNRRRMRNEKIEEN